MDDLGTRLAAAALTLECTGGTPELVEVALETGVLRLTSAQLGAHTFRRKFLRVVDGSIVCTAADFTATLRSTDDEGAAFVRLVSAYFWTHSGLYAVRDGKLMRSVRAQSYQDTAEHSWIATVRTLLHGDLARNAPLLLSLHARLCTAKRPARNLVSVLATPLVAMRQQLDTDALHRVLRSMFACKHTPENTDLVSALLQSVNAWDLTTWGNGCIAQPVPLVCFAAESSVSWFEYVLRVQPPDAEIARSGKLYTLMSFLHDRLYHDALRLLLHAYAALALPVLRASQRLPRVALQIVPTQLHVLLDGVCTADMLTDFVWEAYSGAGLAVLRLLLLAPGIEWAFDVNAPVCGAPLLSHVVQGWAFEAVPVLLERGANPNARGLDGRTALHAAALCLRHDAIQGIRTMQLLLKHGANPNETDLHGNTPLHVACAPNASGNFAPLGFVLLLLKAGADPNRTNADGMTPRDLGVMYDVQSLQETFAPLMKTDTSRRVPPLELRHLFSISKRILSTILLSFPDNSGLLIGDNYTLPDAWVRFSSLLVPSGSMGYLPDWFPGVQPAVPVWSLHSDALFLISSDGRALRNTQRWPGSSWMVHNGATVQQLEQLRSSNVFVTETLSYQTRAPGYNSIIVIQPRADADAPVIGWVAPGRREGFLSIGSAPREQRPARELCFEHVQPFAPVHIAALHARASDAELMALFAQVAQVPSTDMVRCGSTLVWITPQGGVMAQDIGSGPETLRALPLVIPVQQLLPTLSPRIALAAAYGALFVLAVFPQLRVLASFTCPTPATFGLSFDRRQLRVHITGQIAEYPLDLAPYEAQLEWSRAQHRTFPSAFRAVVRELARGACVRSDTGLPLCPHSPLHLLPPDMLEHIIVLVARDFNAPAVPA